MKVCSFCKYEKPFEEFYKVKEKVTAKCKACLKEYNKEQHHKHKEKRLSNMAKYRKESTDKVKEGRRRHYKENRESVLKKTKEYNSKTKEQKRNYDLAYRQNNSEKVAENRRQYYLKNKDRLIKYQLEYRENNSEKISKRASDYKRVNRPLFNMRSANRRTHKINATVSWCDSTEMLRIYAQAKRFSDWLGISYHVDHIIPLIHPLVCGLHNEHNLQIITARDNLIKSNKFNPENFEMSFHKPRERQYMYLNFAGQAGEDTGHGQPPPPPTKP